MIIPKIGKLYRYKDKKVGLIAQKIFFHVYVIQYNEDNNNSTFQTFNWINFMLNAVEIGDIKSKNSAY